MPVNPVLKGQTMQTSDTEMRVTWYFHFEFRSAREERVGVDRVRTGDGSREDGATGMVYGI